jgi:hypothetical protein
MVNNKILLEITPEVLSQMTDADRQITNEFALKEIGDYMVLLQKKANGIFSTKRYKTPVTVKHSIEILKLSNMTSFIRGAEVSLASLEEMANVPFFNLVMTIPISVALVFLL